ncbi:MAG: DUF503 domain-containing protein [Desulfobacterales bacterium]|jgi:hypothetical protein|nr:DUF503 domain-containing protein [Desulfobacteraceae bacterium]MDD3990724.1 DUF503 domain-containing protein [Desulfobacteraceae bacterium]MDY0310999.1 DUF503 domain-containing protein [Desulfobacterales bacterium]
MVVGCGRIVLRIHDCRSLKAKRRVVKAVIARIRNRFNVSVAEIEDNDVYQRAVIGLAVVSNAAGEVDARIEKILDHVEEMGLAEMVGSEMEIIHL